MKASPSSASTGINETLAERQLRQLRFVLEQSGVGLAHLDTERRYLFANAAYASRVGSTPEAIVGKNITAVLPPEIYDVAKPQIAAVLAGTRTEFTVRIGSANGERWLHTAYTPEIADDGTVNGWVAVSTDITEHKQREEAVRLSEERHRALVGQAAAGIAETDLTGRFLFVNNRYCRMTGYGRNELLQMRMQDITHPDDLPGNIPLFKRAVEQGTSFRIEKRYVRRNGETVWVNNNVSLVKNADGSPRSILAVSIDVTQRKEAEEKLQRSEERYRAFVAQSAEAIWRFELEQPFDIALPVEEQIEICYRGAYLAECNDAMARMYGFEKASDIVGARIGDLLPRENPASISYLSAFIQSGYNLSNVESEERDKDGNAVFFLNNLTGIVENGQMLRAWGTQRDITQQKRDEALLRHSESRYRNLFNSMDQGFCVLEMLFDDAGRPVDYRFVEINHVFEKQTGLVNALGRTALELVPGLEAHWFEIYGRVAVTGEPLRFTSDSKAMGRWFEVSAFKLDGGTNHVALLFTDITERRLYEENLRRINDRFAVAETALDGFVYDYDVVKQTVWRSLNFTRVLGYEQGDVEATSDAFASLIHPDERQVVEQSFRDTMAGDRLHFIAEYRVRRKAGDYVWIRDHGIIERDTDGRPLRMTGSTVNIHSHKLFTQNLEQLVEHRTRSLSESKALLERLNTELASFAHVASHDLREPVRKVLSFSDYLARREKNQLSDRGVDYLLRLINAARRMDRLLDGLLTFSRVNTYDARREPVDLNAVLSQARSQLADAIAHTGALVESQALPTYTGVAFQLRQLFIDVLDNAIKFRKPAEEPRIAVMHCVVNGDAVPTLDPSRRYLRISVRDNGIGFEPQFAERVFELFQRLHSKDQYPGTGIGLSVCRKIAENHGGAIVAESTPGIGSVFHVFLPLG